MLAAPGAFSMHQSSSSCSSSSSGSFNLPGALQDTRAPAESSSRWRSCLGTLGRALCFRAEEDFDCQTPSSPSSGPSRAYGTFERSDAAGSTAVQLVALEDFLRCVEPADACDTRVDRSDSSRTPADVHAQTAEAGNARSASVCNRAGEEDPPALDRGCDSRARTATRVPAPCREVRVGEAQEELDEEEEEEEECCICLEPLGAESAYAETAGAKEASDAALHTLKLECCGKSVHTECAKRLQNGDCPLCRSAHVPALCRLRLPAIIKSLYETVVDGEQAALIITLPEALREIAPPLRHLVRETRERQCIMFLKDFNDLQAACGPSEDEVHSELLKRAAGAAATLEENQRTTRRYSADVLLPEPYTRSLLPGGRRSGFALGLRGAFDQQQQERRRSASDAGATA